MLNGQIRVGIYGGTFAPVHNGHVAAAKAFIEQMQLDILYVIPAGIPPHKQIDAADDPMHRYRMCELAFWDVEKVFVSDVEIKRTGKSYTVDTLRELSAPDRRLFLLMGTDMMLTLDQWRESARSSSSATRSMPEGRTILFWRRRSWQRTRSIWKSTVRSCDAL